MREIPSILSKCFKEVNVDTVHAMRYLSKASRLELFKNKSFEKLPHIKQFLGRCKGVDGEMFEQNIKLIGFDEAIASGKVRKGIVVVVVGCTSERLEEENSEFLFNKVARVLNTEGWLRNNKYGDNKTKFAKSFFRYTNALKHLYQLQELQVPMQIFKSMAFIVGISTRVSFCFNHTASFLLETHFSISKKFVVERCFNGTNRIAFHYSHHKCEI